MRTLDVIEPQITIERSLQGPDTREVLPAKGNPPVLVQDRSLDPFDKAVGPRVSRFRPGDPNRPPLAPPDKRALELVSPVGQDALQPPAGRAIGAANRRVHEPPGVGRRD